LAEPKNPFAILDVAERLRGEEITFEIAGGGKLEENVREEIDERGLTNVTLHGHVTDVPGFLSEVDVYFQPSLYEGLCITVLEAMATGLPVVASDVGGIGESVDHGESGFLYKPEDIDGFESGISKLARDPSLRSDFGECGRNTVKDGYTQEVLVSRFEEALGIGEE
jgi:glycosyltransferase involved in cell wall biosynthesis